MISSMTQPIYQVLLKYIRMVVYWPVAPHGLLVSKVAAAEEVYNSGNSDTIKIRYRINSLSIPLWLPWSHSEPRWQNKKV